MANENRKDFNAMLRDSKDMPKFQTITDQKSIEKYGGSAIYDICDHFGIERSSAYNRKNRALSHLVTLLFGKAWVILRMMFPFTHVMLIVLKTV